MASAVAGASGTMAGGPSPDSSRKSCLPRDQNGKARCTKLLKIAPWHDAEKIASLALWQGDTLGVDLWLRVLSWLPEGGADLSRVMAACRGFRVLAGSARFWTRIDLRRHPAHTSATAT